MMVLMLATWATPCHNKTKANIPCWQSFKKKDNGFYWTADMIAICKTKLNFPSFQRCGTEVVGLVRWSNIYAGQVLGKASATSSFVTAELRTVELGGWGGAPPEVSRHQGHQRCKDTERRHFHPSNMINWSKDRLSFTWYIPQIQEDSPPSPMSEIISLEFAPDVWKAFRSASVANWCRTSFDATRVFLLL